MSNWYIIPSDNDLMHHGVKGMRWGVRNTKQSSGISRSNSNSEYSSRNTKKSSSSFTKKGTSGTPNSKTGSGSSAPVNSMGGAALAGGASLEELEKLEDILKRLRSGSIDYSTIPEGDLDIMYNVLYGMYKKDKSAYYQFLKEVPYAVPIIREFGFTDASDMKSPAWLNRDIGNKRKDFTGRMKK